MHTDDLIALIGLTLFLTGLYLWLGLPAPLMVLGLTLIAVAIRLPPQVEEQENDESN